MTETTRQGTEPTGAGAGEFHTRVALHTPVAGQLASEIERRLLFVSSQITGYELDTADGEVRGVTLRSAAPLPADELTEKVNRVVDGDVRKQRTTPPKSVWTSSHDRVVEEGTFELLARAGAVTEAGEGQVAVGEPLLSLLAYFDRAVKRILGEDFNPTEYRYPTLISTEALATAGYFASFPQHLMFVTRLHNDIDVYQGFQRSYGETGIDSTVLDACHNVDYCLPPTMCYHTFHQYRGRTLDAEGVHVVTAKGKSFRFEAAYATTMERLWDFTIREIVFMGPREDVLASRELFMRKIFAFVDELGLSGFCEVGNDPFFGGDDTSARIWSQRLMELKYELRLTVAPGRTIAVGSFNFHDDLFGRGFGIDYGTEGTARSACVGFGLERLVYAFLCQYGLDSAGWPATVREGARAVGGAV
ncbi:class-II aminoacyl-tRNA synthetase family protein [Streptomyces luteogriseus]|uniref:hypothetical protein n=1 Tax=Streptomyces luteogriseus TaxID=68233 RepID=UPI0036CF0102